MPPTLAEKVYKGGAARPLEAYKAGYDEATAMEFPEMQLGHMYRHPKKPGEVWAPSRS